MASRECSVQRISIVWLSIFFWACLVLTTPGIQAFKFLSLPPNPPFYSGHFGLNIDINCTTDDANATVTLLHGSSPPLPERPLSPNKLILNQQVFTVLNLVTSDAGVYSCKATNQSGKTIQWPGFGMLLIRSIALPKHFVFIPAKAIIVLQGQSGSVTCESEGASTVTLKWEKDITGSGSYQPVPESQVKVISDTGTNMLRAILQITNARLSDSGTYRCTVKVQHLSRSRLMTIRIDAPTAPTIEPYLGSLLIKEGEQKIVKCEAKGSPKPDVTWYREGKRINGTECGKYPNDCEGVAYEIYEEGETSPQHTPWTVAVLKIRSALYPRDQGEFKCIASNGNPPSPEKTFTFDVQAPPQIFRRNNQAIARYQKEVDKETQVSCSIKKSNPLPTFKWYYQPITCPELDNNCKPLEDQWNLVPTQLLTPPTAKQTNKSIIRVESDQGNAFYRCQANNSLGNDSYLIMFVRVASGTQTVEVDSRTKSDFNEGSTLKMYCIDHSYGFETIHFIKDGKQLSPGVDPRVNITHEQKAGEADRLVLSVKNLTLNDSGNYQCVMELDPREFGSINITVKKLIAPDITGLVDQRVLQKKENGDPVLLKCIVSGNPFPTITWYFYKNGQGEGEIVTDPGSGLDNNLDACKKRHSGFFFLRKNDPSHLVICSPDYEKQQGRYHCHVQNIAGKMEKSAFVDIEMEPDIEEPRERYTVFSLKIGDTLNLTCKAKGNPAPNVTWIKNSTAEIVATSQTNSNQLIVESMKDEDFGLYTCVASNKLRRTVVSVEVEKAVVIPVAQKGDTLSTGALVGITVGVSLFVIIILVICCILYRRQKKQIDEYKQLYFLQQSDYKIDPDRSLLEQCNDLPYDPDWEFPEERLLLGNILGAGAFGQVIRAEAIGILALNPRDKSAESFKRRSKIRRSSRTKDLKKEEGNGAWKNAKIPVAVKTLKEGASREEYKDLASELKILIHLGQHKNIVNLLGACTRGKRLMVIMEFAPHGSLLSFLRGKRDIHEATWTKTMNDPEKEFTLVDLVMTGFQVARGMSFLASRKCVHRDLAARNILVGEDYVMKIADFGLARDIYKDDLYVKKTQGLLPVKWMAPESLFDRIYTEKTDVWSFGILLWEAFTLGGTPYPGLPTEQLLDYLSEGKRMDMPARCPLEVYTIMRDCWIQEPEQRPKFTTLTERLATILEKNTSKDNPYLALQMEEEAQPSQGYYMQPVDDGGIRESKRYVKSPVHSPTSDTSEPPNFGDAGSAHKGADGMGYDSPLPTLPPGLPVMSDEDIPHDPLPPIPPPYETVTRSDSAGGESGIDMDATDDGYVDDARVDSPFLPRPGNKPVAIEMDKYNKVPKEKILPNRRHGNYETEL